MEIVKSSVLEFLGKNSKRYHSCVATTYSFDFSFFESRVLSFLRATGIRNTLVLIDKCNLIQLLTHPTGLEMVQNANYGIYPISASGVFHPKLILCAGKAEGFLAIGSGNLTSSGHGRNDELWSVFHFDQANQDHAALFNQAWKYLRSFDAQIVGNSKDKLDRLELHSPWLRELEAVPLDSTRMLVPVLPGERILPQLESHFSPVEVAQIDILSPYYDAEGAMLKELKGQYPSARLRVILDSNQNLLPYDYDEEETEFHDWQKLKLKPGSDFERLHGKLIVFRLNDGTEWILTGSSNSTVAALGTQNAPALNHELNILFNRQKSKILEDLGIRIGPDSKIHLQSIQSNTTRVLHSEERPNSYPVVVLLAELTNDKLFILSTKELENASLVLYDRQGEEIDRMPDVEFSLTTTVAIQAKENLIHTIQIHDKTGSPLSNKMVVQLTSVHVKGNPDPRYHKLQQLELELEGGNFENIKDLLQYIDWEVMHLNDSAPSQGIISKAEHESEELEEGRILSQEEFNRMDENVLSGTATGGADAQRVLEILSHFKWDHTSTGVDVNEQLSDIDGEVGEVIIESDHQPAVSMTPDQVKRARKAVLAYLKRYEGNVTKKFETQFIGPSRHHVNRDVLKLHDYNHMMIALELFKICHAKTAGESKDQEENSYYFLGERGALDSDRMKSFILDSGAKFVMMSHYFEQNTGIDYTGRALTELRTRTMLNMLFFCCNMRWESGREHQYKSILRDCILTMVKADTSESIDSAIQDFFNQMIAEKKIFIHSRFYQNWRDMENDLIPRILTFFNDKGAYLKPANECRLGDYVYTSAYGSTRVVKVEPGAIPPQTHLVLSKPGFSFCERFEAPIVHESFKRVHVLP